MAAPGLLDRYLARTAWEAQERQKLVAPDRSDNLYSPVSDLHRTRGSFGYEASDNVWMWSGTTARLALAAAAMGLAGTAAFLMSNGRRKGYKLLDRS